MAVCLVSKSCILTESKKKCCQPRLMVYLRGPVVFMAPSLISVTMIRLPLKAP